MKKGLLKTSVLALTCSIVLTTGCVTTGNSTASNSATTNETMAKASRSEIIADLASRIDKVGDGKITEVSMTTDAISTAVLAVATNQKELLLAYRKIANNHRDVQSFLMANQGKSDEEVQAAAIEFDKGAKNESQKIAAKLAAYDKAGSAIWGSNIKLAATLGVEGTKIAYFTAQNSKQLLIETAQALYKGKSVLMQAADEMKQRVDLSLEANAMIRADSAIVSTVKEMQTVRTASAS